MRQKRFGARDKIGSRGTMIHLTPADCLFAAQLSIRHRFPSNSFLTVKCIKRAFVETDLIKKGCDYQIPLRPTWVQHRNSGGLCKPPGHEPGYARNTLLYDTTWHTNGLIRRVRRTAQCSAGACIDPAAPEIARYGARVGNMAHRYMLWPLAAQDRRYDAAERVIVATYRLAETISPACKDNTSRTKCAH